MNSNLCWLLVCGSVPEGEPQRCLLRAAEKAVRQRDGEENLKWATNFGGYDLLHCVPSEIQVAEWALKEECLGQFLGEGDTAYIFCRSQIKGHRARLEGLEELAGQRGATLVRSLI